MAVRTVRLWGCSLCRRCWAGGGGGTIWKGEGLAAPRPRTVLLWAGLALPDPTWHTLFVPSIEWKPCLFAAGVTQNDTPLSFGTS